MSHAWRLPSRLDAYFLVITTFVLLLSGGWMVDAGSSQLKFALYVAFFALMLLGLRIKVRLDKSAFVVLVWMALFLAVHVVMLSPDLGGVGSIGLKLALAAGCGVVYTTHREEPLEQICRVLTATVVVSVPLYVAAVAFPQFLMVVPERLQETDPTRTSYFLTMLGVNYHMVTPLQEGFLKLRNQSFFWEPGVYGSFLNISIYYCLNRWGACKRLVLLYVGLLSTLSVGAIGINLALLVAYSMKRRGLGFAKTMLLMALVCVATVTFVDTIVVALSSPVEAIFGRVLAEDASFMSRIQQSYVPFLTAMDSWLLGFGYKNIDPYQFALFQLYGISDLVISNSFAQLAYYFGFVALAGYVALILRSSRPLGADLAVLLILTLMHEPIYLSPAILLLLMTCHRGPISVDRGYAGRRS